MGLLVLVIFGVICAVVAASKGRSVVAWFFLGFFFHVFSLIAVFIVSDVKEAETHRSRMEQENHRLREQLRQEQIKAEAFRTHAQRRLDAHDEKLGIDTRPDDRLFQGAAPLAGLLANAVPPFASLAPSASAPAPAPATGGAGWYYAVDGQTLGPVVSLKIAQMLRANTIPWGTLVWTEGMADWAPADRVPQLGALVSS